MKRVIVVGLIVSGIVIGIAIVGRQNARQNPGDFAPYEIAYCQNGRLYIQNERMRAVIAQDPPCTGEAVWSPDGKRIAYIGRMDDTREIYIANTQDDIGYSRLTNNGYDESELAWSPDSKRLAFTVEGKSVAIIDIETGIEQKILHNATDAIWSPDSTKLAYVWTPPYMSGGSLELEVHIYDVFSGGDILVAEGNLQSWSPDGVYLAFLQNDTELTSEVVLVDTRTLEAHIISSPEASGQFQQPVWSPDGSVILYVEQLKHDDINLYDVATGVTSTIQSPQTVITSVSFSPEGALVVFTGRAKKSPFSICIWDLKGDSSPRVVATKDVLVANFRPR